MVNIFDYTDYKAFIKATEEERASLQRGFRSRLAETLECQNAYISQILNTHANFSLEQALKVTTFLQLKENETRYFMLLVDQARAATPALPLRGANAVDSYDHPEPFDASVDEPTDEYLEGFAFWAMPYLDARSWRHYLPRLIEYALAHPGDPHMVVEATVRSLLSDPA